MLPFLDSNRSRTIIGSVGALVFASLSPAAATLVISDPMGDGNVATNTDGTNVAPFTGAYQTVNTGTGGTITEAVGGPQTYAPADANWTRSELHSSDVFAFPTSGSNVFTWTVGNISISTDRSPNTDGDGGRDFRVQLGAISSNRAQGAGSERWLVTEGMVSIDLLFNLTDAGGNPFAAGNIFAKDDEDPTSNDGANIGSLNLAGWDWQNTTNTFTLEVDSSGFTWSESVNGSSFNSPWSDAANGFDDPPAEFAGGMWAFHMGQNYDVGRGTSQLSGFTATIPEPTAGLLSALGFAFLLRRRRR